jgi:hypothetical protein
MAYSDSKSQRSQAGDIDWLGKIPVIGPMLYRSLEEWQRTFAPRYYEPAYVRYAGRTVSPRRTPRTNATRR